MNWPPDDGFDYVQSNDFGTLLLDVVKQAASVRRSTDFTDAVAQVYAWFDDRLTDQPDFISCKRFPTIGSFKAYVRQAVWNAARLAERKRQRSREITALPSEFPIMADLWDPVMIAIVQEEIGKLADPWKSILLERFFDERDDCVIASVRAISIEEVHDLFEQAIDKLKFDRGR